MSTKLYVFSSGILKTTKEKLLFATGIGEPFDIPVPYFLVDVDGTKILIDTGISPGCIKDPKGTWGDVINIYYPVMKEEEQPVVALSKLGIKREDISYIIQTHLHLDHAGSTKFFPNAKVIVQLNELRYAFFPDPLMDAAYIKNDIKDPNIKWEPIVGFRSMFNGAIFIIPTPGHTPGHQSVLVRLQKHKSVILTGDSIYLKDNFEKNIPSGFALNFADAAYSVQSLGELAKAENAEIWYGHDPEFFKTIKLAPEYYE